MAKFKVDDWVIIKGSMYDGQREPSVKAHILEVMTQLCEAGIEQVTYLCRVFVKDLKHGWAASIKETRFREMELEEITKDP